jgi:hypothetical protein
MPAMAPAETSFDGAVIHLSQRQFDNTVPH